MFHTVYQKLINENIKIIVEGANLPSTWKIEILINIDFLKLFQSAIIFMIIYVALNSFFFFTFMLHISVFSFLFYLRNIQIYNFQSSE